MPQLVSPGVSVSVIDESAYASAGNGTVPVIAVATRQDRSAPDGTTALYTTQAYANLPLTVSSQRELVQLFGEPEFTIVDGTPIQGHELNEYGLLAAYYYLGVANRAVILRADLDMAQLEPQDIAPVGPAANGTYWFDTATTSFGLFEGNGSNWVAQSVMVSDGQPSNSEGSDGDYALDVTSTVKKFYKKVSGAWVSVDSATLSANVTVGPHYEYPTPTNGDVWFKTTSPNSGFSLVVKRYNATLGSWSTVLVGPGNPDQLVAFSTDGDAETAFDVRLSDGDVYVQASGSVAEFEIRQYSSGSWDSLTHEASSTEPTGDVIDGTLWYDAGTTVDIYRKTADGWETVGDVTVDTIEPTSPSVNEVWVDTNDLVNYPVIKVWDGSAWIEHDNADQTTPNGVVFADLTSSFQDISGVNGTATPMDDEAPNEAFYPAGMLVFNTAVSSGNVKRWNADAGHWQSESGNRDSGPKAGAMYAFDKAQRRVVVKRLQAAFAGSEELRDETLTYNLITCPGYPELIDEMLTLNVDRKETAFVIADSPMKLANRIADINAWALGTNAGTNGEDGLITRNAAVAVYYPSALSTDLNGNDVAVPASHAVLRAYAYNDQVAYPWFAPAGLTRGAASGVSNFGIVTAENEFKALSLNQGQRDALYEKSINPLVNFPGQGLYVWGQKTLHPFSSALDRVNVARLLAYLRERFDVIARPFIFEPNDKRTRDRVINVFNGFLADLITKRALYDFLVVCDETNNTPIRIDRNELWIDVAIEPVKAAEFIYIPVRVVNTGAIANGTR
jgi:hypothetical protein